jgi:peptidoglycan/LPS O-acetylase OafA/YrhL
LVLGCLGIGEYLGYRALSQVMWFVPFVLQVYALLPLMNWLVARVYPASVLIAAFGLTLLVTTAVYAYWPAGAADISCRWSPVFRLAEVCLGVFLGRCLARRRRPSGAIAFAALYLAVSGAFVLLRDGEKYSSPIWLVALPWSGLIVGALITLTSVLLLLVLRRIAPRLNYRLLGAASFPFFLIHAAGIQTVYGKFGANAFVWLAYYVLCWAAAFVLATLDRQWRMLVLARPVGRQSAQAAPATNSFPASTAPPAVPQSAHDAKTLR